MTPANTSDTSPTPTDVFPADPGDEQLRIHVDEAGDWSPSVAVAWTLSFLRDRDPADIDPLYSAVDPELVDKLVRGGSTGRLRFASNGYAVTVYSDGNVEFRPN